jgi:catechol 2,3-dioxygenase-like lactoylglutathione lyase family enzyme
LFLSGRGKPMIDHIIIPVADSAAGKQFYLRALAPLGYKVVWETLCSNGELERAGFGVASKMDFVVGTASSKISPIHVAFRAENRGMVDAFYEAAIAAGAADNGKPGLCPEYHENYYGAFVLDPDGHNIEAVCHEP